MKPIARSAPVAEVKDVPKPEPRAKLVVSV